MGHSVNCKRVYVFILCVVSLLSYTGTLSDENRDAETIKKMEQLKKTYQLPSFSLAIGLKGEIVFSKAIGLSDIDGGKKATIDTQYSIGSIAKSMTGIALATLVDDGKVQLDTRVSKYIEDPLYTQYITVRQLAAHIAGVPHKTDERYMAEFINTKNHKSPFDAFYVFSSKPLLFEPGSDFKYSSNGYILLSAVIEKASKMNYVDYLRESLWMPLRMKNTELDTSFAGERHETKYYDSIREDGKYIASVEKRDRSFLFGAGGFISTPSDLIRMSQAVFDDKFLSRSIKKTFLSPVRMKNGKINPQKYSLGWRVGEMNIHGKMRTTLHHGGVTYKAATSYLLLIPECKSSIAFATNYVPKKFWRMRPKIAEILAKRIKKTECANINT